MESRKDIQIKICKMKADSYREHEKLHRPEIYTLVDHQMMRISTAPWLHTLLEMTCTLSGIN